jgi:hypothetical protein
MRSNAKNPNNPAYKPGHRGGGLRVGADDQSNNWELLDELTTLRGRFEAIARGPGKGFENRYLDPELLENFLRFQELQYAVYGIAGRWELEEEFPAASALGRILDGESYRPSREALISRLIRGCPDLESSDPTLLRLQEWLANLGYRQEGRGAALHVGYIGWIMGTWELPRPSGVLSFPPAVREAIAALAAAPSLAELLADHAKTLISLLTEPETCGDWRDATVAEARCPHCRCQELSPVSEEESHFSARLPALRFAHHPGKLYSLPLRHRICLECGYVMSFVDRGEDGLGAVRKLLR